MNHGKKLVSVCSFAMLSLGCGSDDNPSSASESASVPDEFVPLCEESGVHCASGDTAPQLDETFLGVGTTRSSDNDLWAVDESANFGATMDLSVAGQVSGYFDMDGFELEVEGATYLGEGETFTIYGSDLFEDENCSIEAQAIITGTRNGSTGELQGELVLEFTDSITDNGCEPEVFDYPGTGAVFTFNASPVDCASKLAEAGAFVAAETNRQCESDFDCDSENVGCANFENTLCGAVPLSSTARFSDEWEELERATSICSDRTCSLCQAELVPQCVDGLCQ